MTGTVTAFISGLEFIAIPVTFTFADPETPIVVTYEFPSVTLSSLSPLETLTFVRRYSLELLTCRLKPGLPLQILYPDLVYTRI
jgi:hypothetical protein